MPHYLLLDGARLESRMGQGMGLNGGYRSLYRGAMDADLEAVGPYLFTFPHSEQFRDWFVEKGLGDHWGILFESDQDFDRIYNHLRRFLTVKTEDDVQLYFRFYDPRVLRIFLPTCDKGQLKEMFGPIQRFIAEDDNLDFVLSFRLDYEGFLQTERLDSRLYFRNFDAASRSKPENPVGPASSATEVGPAQEHTPAPARKKWYFLDE